MSHLRSLLAPLAVVAALSGSLSPVPARAQVVVVDGDLSDLMMHAPAAAPDRATDVTGAFVSGWDFTHVWVFYNPKNDTLYVGIHLQPNGAFPGVPGDADGDRDPSHASRLDVPDDQFGVGSDEAYVVAIDGDVDGQFDGAADMMFVYRRNATRLIHSDGPGPMEGMGGEIAVGLR